MEHFKAAAIAADSKNMDPVLKYCAVGRQLGYAMYLSFDMITYVKGPSSPFRACTTLTLYRNSWTQPVSDPRVVQNECKEKPTEHGLQA